MIEDLFYEKYSNELHNKSIGEFTNVQFVICFILWSLMAVSGLAVFGFAMKAMTGLMVLCLSVCIVVTILLSCLLNKYERLSREGQFTGDFSDRINCLKNTIVFYFMDGIIDDKVAFMKELYQEAIKRKEKQEKLYRGAGVMAFTAIGAIITNVIEKPKSSAWQFILLVAISSLLVVGPFIFAGAFDRKKKVYSFMLEELQAVNLLRISAEIQAKNVDTLADEQMDNKEAEN